MKNTWNTVAEAVDFRVESFLWVFILYIMLRSLVGLQVSIYKICISALKQHVAAPSIFKTHCTTKSWSTADSPSLGHSADNWSYTTKCPGSLPTMLYETPSLVRISWRSKRYERGGKRNIRFGVWALSIYNLGETKKCCAELLKEMGHERPMLALFRWASTSGHEWRLREPRWQ